jgi:hypothetical protein
MTAVLHSGSGGLHVRCVSVSEAAGRTFKGLQSKSRVALSKSAFTGNHVDRQDKRQAKRQDKRQDKRQR